MHDTFKISKKILEKDAASDAQTEQMNVTTDFPEDLKTFYTTSNINFRKFSETQRH